MIPEESIVKTLRSVFEKMDFSDKSLLPSEFAEKYIKLDSSISSLKQGTFSYDLTPYAREIVDTASPYHPAKLIAVMKGAQIGISQSIIVPAIMWKNRKRSRQYSSFVLLTLIYQKDLSSKDLTL